VGNDLTLTTFWLATTIGLFACAPRDVEIGSNLEPTASNGTASAGTASTGAGGSVLGCSGGTVGTWVDITPPGIDLAKNDAYGVRAVTLDPTDPATVFVTADYQGIWKSSDCGAHWMKLTTGQNGSAFDTGVAWLIAIDPTDHDVMYTTSSLGLYGLWKSVNGGVDWVPLFGPGNVSEPVNPFGSSPDIDDVAIDPSQHLHVIASFHGPWKASNDAGVLETTDGGSTWKLIQPASGMGINHTLTFLDGSSRWLMVNDTSGSWVTLDAGASFMQVDNDYHSAGGAQFYRSANGTYYHGGTQGVARSTDGVSWSVIPGTGNVEGLIGDGTHLYSSDAVAWIGQFYGTTYIPFHSAPEVPGDADWAVWGTQQFDNGGNRLAVDTVHHLLYSSSWRVGLLRTSTP
jgi:hypothetical protein